MQLDLAKNSPKGAALEYWIHCMRQDLQIEVAVLDTQIRPQCARDIFVRLGVDVGRVVLVDCLYKQRHARLCAWAAGVSELADRLLGCIPPRTSRCT